MEKASFKDVDQYIATFPEDVQENLKKIRQTIKKAAPDAQEVISYQMPAYRLGGVFAYFAAFSDHYSLFIPPMGVYEHFKEELSSYKISKATLQFPKTKPLPFDLIEKLVKYAAKVHLAMEKQKKA